MARVIVVDDESLVRELYSVWLEDAGHQVIALSSAEAARTTLADMPIDVLLTDIRMTTASEGIDLLAWTRRHDHAISVVLITGVPEVSTAVEALRLAAYDYLVKPVPQESLLRIIARAAEHSSLQRELARLAEENRRYQQHLQQLVDERTRTLERRTNQLLLLNQVVSEISALGENSQEIVDRTLSSLQSILGYQNVAVFEIDRTASVLQVQPADAANAAGYRVPPVTWSVARPELSAQHGRAASGPTAPGAAATGAYNETNDLAVFPIAVGGIIRHVLVVPNKNGVTLDAADTTVLSTLTEHLGIALANADLYGQLRSALLVREQILQNVSHELRTPLTLISGYSELLIEQASLPEPAVEMLNIIADQTEHLASLVNQLLTFQSIETDRIELELMLVDQWLEAQASIWGPILERAGLRLEIIGAGAPVVIMGSWDFLSEVMQNLLDNARKFSPQGGTVTISVKRGESEAVFSVTDQGIGVSPDKLPQLFERFYQAEAGVTRRFGGMGIGLALVREIIVAHHGRVWAESPGEGNGFTVSFAIPLVD